MSNSSHSKLLHAEEAKEDNDEFYEEAGELPSTDEDSQEMDTANLGRKQYSDEAKPESCIEDRLEK